MAAGCFYPVHETTVSNSVGTPSLTSLSISNNLLLVEGDYLHKVDRVHLSGQGKSVSFYVNTQSLKSLSATAASALDLTAGGAL